MLLLLFILLQFILLFFMLFHDWISVPPLNDIATLKKQDTLFYRILGSTINGLTVFVPLLITLSYYGQQPIPFSACITIVSFYFLLTIGTIMSWWVPYFFGSSQKLKQAFSKFQNTHHFLPKRGDNITPNTLHVLLHLQIWICLAIAIYFLMIHF